jgi:aminoglycoside/choline kinase family phosphotransferase
MSNRLNLLEKWLQDSVPGEVSKPAALNSDASFRRYFRVNVDGVPHVVMDAPPDKENNEAFLDIARRLHNSGVQVPDIVVENRAAGFFLLSDLGDDVYLTVLHEDNVERLYGDALAALAAMQVCTDVQGLPQYNAELLQFELALYPDWLLKQHLQIALSDAQTLKLQTCFDFLTQQALAQPQVFVHRDYHARNLLITPSQTPGIIDFQDAVVGPVTYDLVSLLRDCYIVWPRERVIDWVNGYYELALQMGIIDESISATQFIRDFDLMGVQRHVKVAGIFARLCHRDGKQAYLKDIPTALKYILEVAPDYPELAFLLELTQDVAARCKTQCA